MSESRRLFRNWSQGSRLQGFLDVSRDAVSNFASNGDTNQAAAIALYAFLSIIPLFILSVLAAGRILGSQPQIQSQLIQVLEGFHPGFSETLLGQLGQIDEKRRVLGWIGIGTLVWLSSLIFGAIETALNITFRSRRSRNYFHSKLLAISMIPLGWSVASASILLTTFAGILHLGALLRYVIPYAVSVILLAAMYRLTPTRRLPMRILLTGSVLFAAFMEPVKHFFAWYVANHTRYHEIFGSLETVVVLVIWVFYVALLFLFCAELMSSFERRDLILLERALLAKGHNRGNRLFLKFGRPYPAGTIIFQEGSTEKEMYFILAGKVRLEKKAGQARRTLAELAPGNYFGEMATLVDAPRTATAVAVVDSELAVINGEIFRHLLRESDDMATHMLTEFSHRVRNTNAALEELTQSRMYSAILLHLLRHWPKAVTPIHIAQATESSPSDVLEVLAHFAELGVVEMETAGVRSFDSERAWALLAEYSHGQRAGQS